MLIKTDGTPKDAKEEKTASGAAVIVKTTIEKMSSHERSKSAAIRINSGMDILTIPFNREKSKNGGASFMKGSGNRINKIGNSTSNVRWNIFFRGNREAIANEVNIEKSKI